MCFAQRHRRIVKPIWEVGRPVWVDIPLEEKPCHLYRALIGCQGDGRDFVVGAVFGSVCALIQCHPRNMNIVGLHSLAESLAAELAEEEGSELTEEAPRCATQRVEILGIQVSSDHK